MLTPAKYWRIPCEPADEAIPADDFDLPVSIASHASPPKAGHGVLLADYDQEANTGLISNLGVIREVSESRAKIEWRRTEAQIWVDSPAGRGFWKKGAFAFAASKIAGYGLHELFGERFPELDLRQQVPAKVHPANIRSNRVARIAPERLIPIEVVGTPTLGPRVGVVYVLKSAYGYKVGRTRNVPERMRAFGVHLPFIYTIPLCAWFDDCVEAERIYHKLFESKRINGEWFDLVDHDIELVRSRVAAGLTGPKGDGGN